MLRFATILFLVFSFSNANAQGTFQLTDTVFKVGSVYRTIPLLYDYSCWNIGSWQPESKPIVDSILNFCIKNKNLTVEIGFHSDQRGTKAFNFELTLKRAEMLRDYLISKGVWVNKVVAKGYGESKSLIDIKTINRAKTLEQKEEMYERNRRMELKIISLN